MNVYLCKDLFCFALHMYNVSNISLEIELPSLEQIEEMERQREAIDALEIS